MKAQSKIMHHLCIGKLSLVGGCIYRLDMRIIGGV